jgi:hypothetical protein
MSPTMAWAFSVALDLPAERLVLATYALHADAQQRACLSHAQIRAHTKLDRKTIMKAVRRLVERGLLSTTATRQGSTNRMVVYRVNVPDARR